MARIEEDREDLMKEATALIRRMELQIHNQEDLLFAGYKRSGDLSIYFTQDLVYHFDDQQQLRRAFIHPDLFRSEGNSLTRMKRVRTETTSELHTTDLSDDELKQFQSTMLSHVQNLLKSLTSNKYKLMQQIPEEIDLVAEFIKSLEQILVQNGKLSLPIVKR